MEQLEYSVEKHGDLLEMHEYKFIENELPSYQEIWKRFIGHQGNGQMADMLSISDELNVKRIKFAQHHYTVLESLILMNQIVKDPILSDPVNTMKEYYRILNLIMSFQAHAGRVRDNLEKCYGAIGNIKNWAKVEGKMKEFWDTRHIFIHGCKVPFMLDEDKLFKSADPQVPSKNAYGYTKDSTWNSITSAQMSFINDQLNIAHQGLVIVVNDILSDLILYVKQFIEVNSLSLVAPKKVYYLKSEPSASMGNQGSEYPITISGRP